MTYEELEEKLLKKFGSDVMPGITKEFLDRPDMKKLFEEHNSLVAKGVNIKAQAEQEVPFAQSARFIRAIYNRDKSELAEIQKEELPKWQKNGLIYMSERDSVQGGHLVPIEFFNEIQRLPCTYGIARRDCRVIPMNSSSMRIPTSAGLPTMYWITTEGTDEKTESKPTFGLITLNAVTGYVLVVFTEELLADATPPLVQYILEVSKEAISAGEDNALFNGNAGAGITGVLACGTQVTMDLNRKAFHQIHTDDLIKMADGVACNAEMGGKYYFNKNILAHLRMLKTTTGAYILNEVPITGGPGMLNGYPFETTPMLPGNAASAANTPFVIFTNMKRTVAFGDRQQMTMKMADQATVNSVNLFTHDMQALRLTERLDIECLLPTGITVLYTAP